MTIVRVHVQSAGISIIMLLIILFIVFSDYS